MDTMPSITLLLRLDFLTSAAVDHAVRMQGLCGTETARRYLARTCVPFIIAERVLTSTSMRRPPIPW